MLYLIFVIAVLFLFTSRWRLWVWFQTRSAGQLVVITLVTTLVVFGIVKLAGF